jgi:hypothetical protein
VWLGDAVSGTEICLNADLFEGADVDANVVPEPELRTKSGSLWTLTARQRDVIITVDIFR